MQVITVSCVRFNLLMKHQISNNRQTKKKEEKRKKKKEKEKKNENFASRPKDQVARSKTARIAVSK